MTETTKFNIAINNWIRASKNLGFATYSPYLIDIGKKEKHAFAFLPDYGKHGVIIGLISPPEFNIDTDIIKWARENDYNYSFINVENLLVYNEDFIKELLEDWEQSTLN